MSKRWKPGLNEVFWYINSGNKIDYTTNNGFGVDEEKIAAGNCFFTQAEAQAAAEKVKALLLSLHATQDKALPKLTADVFGRPDCPEWAKYAAVDADGDGFYYEDKPRICEADGEWLVDKCIVGTNRIITGDFDPTDWQNSLIERPAKLPDWCKVGEWVYFWDDAIYAKITKIETVGCSVPIIHFDNNTSRTYGSLSRDDVSQARIRPYNAEEMKALVGEKVTNKEGNIYLCTAFIKETDMCNAAIDIDSWVTAGGLLEYGYTINGKPAGVFEHLEDGEWVE